MAHHIFCNKFMLPEDGCEMCKRLREKYPEDLSPDELVAKYFPDVIVRHLTPLALDGGDSAASEQLPTPEVLSTLQGESTPAHRK